jgi:hypothetical protein
MKKSFPIFIAIALVILSACAAPTTTELPSTESASPELTVITAVVATVEPESVSVPAPTAISTMPDNQNPASYTITLDDNGKTINMRVGDSFLLNLGADVYDWGVNVDNQSVISRRTGDAQIIFDAINSGTANLTATGNPKCHSSSPPCMMPSIMFRIVVVVQ